MTALRADAERNLRRVLDAAVEVFAERGADASVDEVARRAGVGHGTVFRRFPTKDVLVAAVVADRVASLAEVAQAACDEPDAGAAFRGFMTRAAELHATDRALHEGLPGRCAETADVVRAKAALMAAVAELVRRAQEAGALRRDVSVEDMPPLLAAAVEAGGPERWRRTLEIVLDGLAAGTA